MGRSTTVVYTAAGLLLSAAAGVVIAAFAWGGVGAPGVAPHVNDSSPTAAFGIVAGVFGGLLIWLAHSVRGLVLGVVCLAVGLVIGATIYA